MRKEPLILLIVVVTLILLIDNEVEPFRSITDWRSHRKTLVTNKVSFKDYQVLDYTQNDSTYITIDFLKGIHYWNPQIAIWIEDTLGNHFETLFVTNSTAKGKFYGGRSVNNFKEYDQNNQTTGTIRRVNALPYWSNKRGVIAKDGSFAPHPSEPLPDGISGATPTSNFILKKSVKRIPDKFKLLVEINVAFDENEYFSQYDYLEDEVYHNGTGLLGQPSLIYASSIDLKNKNQYYILQLIGHGHHSGKTGELFEDVNKLTTAKKIVERIVVGIKIKSEAT